jgi:hypothetical protein
LLCFTVADCEIRFTQIAPQGLWPQGPRKKESVSNSAGLTQSTVSDLSPSLTFRRLIVRTYDRTYGRAKSCCNIVRPGGLFCNLMDVCGTMPLLLWRCQYRDEFLKRWAIEKRLLIFKAVASDKETGAITSLNGVSPATVWHGLKILSDAALIRCRRRGRFVHNRMLPKAIENYLSASYRVSRTGSSSGFSRTELRGPNVSPARSRDKRGKTRCGF